MSNDLRRTLERVKKYLKLSRSDNPHEAAEAAKRAREMMAEYNLTEAMLRVDEPTRVAEQIVDGVKLDGSDSQKRRVAWVEIVAKAVADSLSCKHYLQGASLVCFGRMSATQTWNYTTLYLCREIERLCDEGWEREGEEARAAGQTIKRWKNAFRVGAANTISTRLSLQVHAERSARNAERHSSMAAAAADANAGTTGIALHNAHAITILEQDEAEVATAYKKRSKDFVSSRGIGTTRSRSGYHAGQEAGGRIPLGAKRAGLGVGQGRLK